VKASVDAPAVFAEAALHKSEPPTDTPAMADGHDDDRSTNAHVPTLGPGTTLALDQR
jgi:hypothetical protein